MGPDGSRLDVKGAIPDLDWVAWEGRRVVIAYDADAVTKDLVRIARSDLAAHLRGRDPWLASLNGTLREAKGSMIILPSSDPKRSWTRLPMSISQVLHGEWTYCAPNHL